MTSLIKVYSIKISQNDWGDTIREETLVGTYHARYRDQTISQATASIGTIYEDVSTFGVRDQIAKKLDRTMTIEFQNQKYSILKINRALEKNSDALIYVKRVV